MVVHMYIRVCGQRVCMPNLRTFNLPLPMYRHGYIIYLHTHSTKCKKKLYSNCCAL